MPKIDNDIKFRAAGEYRPGDLLIDIHLLIKNRRSCFRNCRRIPRKKIAGFGILKGTFKLIAE